jgi:putative membrane-bound dehydrogenase-like protein
MNSSSRTSGRTSGRASVRAFALFTLAAALIAGGIFALSKLHKPAPPTGLKSLHVPAGFKVEKVAGSDLLSYPMMGTFDDRGRLFICESSGNTLNNKQMAEHPDYKVLLLEDRDQDGRFDRSTVFADKLTLPAGAVWYRHSLYVAAPPELLRFEDTDGDGVADVKEAVVAGWNMSSNAASLHGPFFGPDGYLYLTDGRHGFNITTRDGRSYKGMASRIWRVRPDGTGLEWVAGGGFDNPVEVAFMPEGEIIGTMTYFKDPENGERDALLHFAEGGVYPKWYSVVDEFKRTGDLMPVMTRFARIAPAGLARYRGGTFGEEFRDNLFSAQFNPHRVQRHVVSRDKATYRTEDSDFLTSSDPDFHPTDVIPDADGSLLVLDTGAWFIHGCPISRVAKPEIKGAIYRITKVGAMPPADPRGEQIDFAAADPAALAKLIEDQRPFVRDQAVEALVAKGDAAVAALADFRRSASSYEARASAVFALYRIGSDAARQAVRDALSDSDPRVRSAAARCVGMSADRDAVDRLMEMVRKDEAAPRRQAASSLGRIVGSSALGRSESDPMKAEQTIRATAALLDAASTAEDRFVEHSIIYSLITLNQPDPVSAALAHSDGKVRKAALIALDQMDASTLRREQVGALLTSPDKDLRSAALWVVAHHQNWADVVLRYVSERLRQPNLPADEVEGLRETLQGFSDSKEMQQLIANLLEKGGLPETQTLFLLDMMEKSRAREVPASWLAVVGKLLDSPSAAVRLRATELMRARALPGYEEQIQRLANEKSSPDAIRAAALGVLVRRNPQLSAEQFTFLTSRLSASDAVLRQTAARVLGAANPGREVLLELAGNHLDAADPLVLSTVLDSFRTSEDEEVGEALIGVLRNSPSALGTLGEERLRNLFSKYPEKVRQLAEPLFAQLQKAQLDRAAHLQKLEPLLTVGGDTGRGRRIFFGEKAACASCHTIGLDGGKVGPDLTGIGSIRSGHDLLEAIVYPSASFVPGHEIYNVDTNSGRISGVLRSQSPVAVVLITGPNGEVRIPRGEIKAMEQSKISLMPEGFDKSLTTMELADLLAYLQAEKTR